MTRSARPRISGFFAVATVGIAGVVAVALTSDSKVPDARTPSFRATFGQGRNLVTNELAYATPNRRGVVSSPQWIVTSGSLFTDDGTGWTGRPDARLPDLHSAHTTDSAIFRAVSRRNDFQDVVATFDVDIAGLVTTPKTPAEGYDGVHVFLRYQDPQQLYVIDLYRRDGIINIKRKLPGGPANGGTYRTLATATYEPPLRAWVREEARIENTPAGVRITLTTDGRTVLTALDDAREGGPILSAGRVGLRGDNCAFHFRYFVATPLPR